MLDISALKGMTQEEQLKKAAEYANVPVGVLSGIWKQESNQGQHPTMIGPATKWGTAKGHFQILDNVQPSASPICCSEVLVCLYARYIATCRAAETSRERLRPVSSS